MTGKKGLITAAMGLLALSIAILPSATAVQRGNAFVARALIAGGNPAGECAIEIVGEYVDAGNWLAQIGWTGMCFGIGAGVDGCHVTGNIIDGFTWAQLCNSGRTLTIGGYGSDPGEPSVVSETVAVNWGGYGFNADTTFISVE